MKRRIVTLPFPVQELDRYPTELEYNEFHGEGSLDVLAQTELWVPPYKARFAYAKVLPEMPRLRVLQTQTAGTDHIDPWLPPGVTLCNARGVHDAPTAELAVALILASLRGIPAFVTAQQQRTWAPDFECQSLADKTVVVVGFGSIGQALGARLSGFECEVIGVTRRGRDSSRPLSVLPALLPVGDVVVILVPLTDDTHHLVDADFLRRMKDGALLVNMARGPIIDSDALVAELQSGRLSAALDVTDPEPLPPEHPLWGCRSALITPHVGGGTSAMRPRMNPLIESQLFRFAADLPLHNVVSASRELHAAGDEKG